MIEGGFVSKTKYVSNVTGDEIVSEQEKINYKEESKVIATTILASKEKDKFHAWIYYKIRADMMKKEVKINL